MKTQEEVKGKIFKVGDTIGKTHIGDRKILYIAENKYFYIDVYSENGDWISNLKGWSVKKPEREKIELKAYIGNCGVEYLTDEGKVLIFRDKVLTPSNEKNYFYTKSRFSKYSPVPELPSKFVWADSLEYCDSEAGRE